MHKEEIEKLLDEKIRPSLREHGGDVKIISLTENILRVKLTGRCSGCPAAHMTNESLIASEVMQAMPGIKDVVLVEEVSQELLDMAHRILNHEDVV